MRSRLVPVLLMFTALGACASPSIGGSSVRSGGNADPDTVAGDYLQGLFAASQQQYGEAADAFSRAEEGDGVEVLTRSAFRYSLAAGDFQRAAHYAEELLAVPAETEAGDHGVQPVADFLNDDLPRLTLIADHFRTRNYVAAEANMQAPFGSSLGIAIGDLLEAWAVYGTTGGEGAARVITENRQSDFSGFSPLHLALIFDLEGHSEAAEVAYAQARGAPGADFAFRSYAGFVERERSSEQALAFYAELSESGGFLRRIGRMGLARLGEPLDGETREFQKAAAGVPLRVVESPEEGAAIVMLNFAWTAYDRAIEQRQAAIEAGFGELPLNLEVPLTLAQLAVAIDDDLDAAHYIIGAISSYYEQHEAASKAYGKVGPSSWLYNYAAIDRAEALVAMDRRPEAISLIEAYLRQDAFAPDVTLELAHLKAEEDRIDDAIETATRAIEIADALASEQTRGRNVWRYYFARGAIAAEADRWDEAEPDLLRALELQPNDPGLLNYLGYSYVERGERLGEALGMIERALEAQPGSGAITDSLGWAYYQLGEYQRAVELLERAVQLEPGDDVLTDHLGDAYWRAGRKTEARFEWRRVLEIQDLDDDFRARVERKLAGEEPAPGANVGGAAAE